MDRGGSAWVCSAVATYTKDGLGIFCWRWLILQWSDFWTSIWHVPPSFFGAGGVEQVESVCPSLSWIFAVPWGIRCQDSAFLMQSRIQRVDCGLLSILWEALGHCNFSWVRCELDLSRSRRRPWCTWNHGLIWQGIGRFDPFKNFTLNQSPGEKHCACELGFDLAFH